MLFVILITSGLEAESYVREYTYNASENDSKTSARKAALDALKVQLIEEVGISVANSLEKETRVENDDVSKMIKSKVETFSVAMTKTEILDEKWNGESFWIKVKIEVDSDRMKEEVKKSIDVTQNRQKENLFEPLRNEVLLGLYNLRTPKRIRSLTSKAVTLPMEGKKNTDVHKNVLDVFTKYSISDTLYRDFLFSTLKTIEPDWDDSRASWIFNYLSKSKMYTKKESEVLLDFFAKMPKNMPRQYYANFFAPAKTDKEITKLANAYIERLNNGAIGRPVSIPIQKELPTLLRYLPKDVAKEIVNDWRGRI